MAQEKLITLGNLTTYDTKIKELIEEGGDATAKEAIADDFSTTKSYAVGEYCFHLGTLYECTTAHTAGAWNAAHFTATTVGSELSTLNGKLSGISVNWFSFTVPSGSSSYNFSTYRPSDFGGILCAISVSGGGAKIVQCTDTNIFFDTALPYVSTIRITYIVN